MSVIAYYVTGHGYGHAIRSVTIANKIALLHEIIFKTSVPASFFMREMSRPYRLEKVQYDCGCLQLDGVSVDIEGTIERYTALAKQNRVHLDKEVEWCRNNSVNVIVSDITPFAFEIAHKGNIPSVAVTNFTWYDIYQDYLCESPHFRPYLEEMLTQYKMANLTLSLYPSLPMSYFSSITSAPVVGRKGTPCREHVISLYASGDHSKKIALIYVGDFGMGRMDWGKLSYFKEWIFLGINELAGAPENYHTIDFSTIQYHDLTATVDCVISKLGYGVVAECMVNATKLMYLPRTRFLEYPVLESAVKKWGGGIALTDVQFTLLDWEGALEQSTIIPDPEPYSSNGALFCAHKIESLL